MCVCVVLRACELIEEIARELLSLSLTRSLLSFIYHITLFHKKNYAQVSELSLNFK